jgi:hypothetical protein
MAKQVLIEQIRGLLRDSHDAARRAALSARDAATGDEVKSEGKYDTRGVEASYLAAAQAKQVAELAESLGALANFDFPDFAPDEPIAAGALVEVDLAGERRFFLLAPRGGGLTLEHDGCLLNLLTPEAPLRQLLEGLQAGDSLDTPDLMVLGVS